MAETRAQVNRRIRQESLREWLSEKCTAQHFIDNLEKIEGLKHDSKTFTNELAKYRTANEQRLKIMNKYLPDIRAIEHTGEGGGDVMIDQVWEVKVTDAPNVSTKKTTTPDTKA